MKFTNRIQKKEVGTLGVRMQPRISPLHEKFSQYIFISLHKNERHLFSRCFSMGFLKIQWERKGSKLTGEWILPLTFSIKKAGLKQWSFYHLFGKHIPNVTLRYCMQNYRQGCLFGYAQGSIYMGSTWGNSSWIVINCSLIKYFLSFIVFFCNSSRVVLKNLCEWV